MSKAKLAATFMLGTLFISCGSIKQQVLNWVASGDCGAHEVPRARGCRSGKQGGLVGLRYAVPQDWNAGGKFDWNYNRIYLPLRVSTRAEAPDVQLLD